LQQLLAGWKCRPNEQQPAAAVEQAQLSAQLASSSFKRRLGNIVVGSATETADDIASSFDRYKNGHPMALPSQLCAEVAPIAIGQADFEDQGVETPVGVSDDHFGLVQRLRREDGEPMIIRETIRQHLPNSRVIVHDQDGSSGRHGPVSYVALNDGLA
jgi:hypothetical protein